MNLTLELKKLLMPKSNDMKVVDAVQCWEVRWHSRHGEYSGDTRPEIEVFTSRELADEFAQALRYAFSLIRATSGNTVTITKAISAGTNPHA